MKRLMACACLAAVTSLVTAAHSMQEAASARLLIDAVAVDRQGRPVTDLKQEDVEVWIGHFRVPIESFSAVTPGSPDRDDRGGRLVVLVMDDMTGQLTLIARAKEVARRFVTRLSPGDRMAVVMLNGGAMEATSDSARLLHAIDRYTVGAMGVQTVDNLGVHVLKTVSALAGQMVEGPQQRKAIVIIGNGGLLDRPLPPPQAGRDLLPEWIETMRTLSMANANVYVIDPIGVGLRTDAGNSGFARETGGVAFLNTNDLNGAADQIMREAGSYYLMTVASPPVGGRGLRELELKSRRSGVTLRARRAIH
ncbi:MAG TPA: VWA domain-containing protein [Vicinamibacterales bacterium]|nr:VWA domain-containing protein [Vicinamibacterales bacterium]